MEQRQQCLQIRKSVFTGDDADLPVISRLIYGEMETILLVAVAVGLLQLNAVFLI
ncbi:hypothetical protein D3C80_1975900 [compost metagenome]